MERLILILSPIVLYWVAAGFFTLLSSTEYGRSCKIQPTLRSEEQKQSIGSPLFVLGIVLLQQCIQFLLNCFLFSLEADAPIPPLPSWWTVVTQVLLLIFVMETWLYWSHWYLHYNRWAYHYIHAWHHRIEAPYAFSTMFQHPLEGLCVDMAAGVIGCLLVQPHPYVSAGVFCVTTLKSVDDHCGLSLWWDPLQCIFPNSTLVHDLHHVPRFARYNLSQPWFIWWDKIMGTYMDPKTAAELTAGTNDDKDKSE